VSHPRILGGSAKGRELDTPRRGTRPSPSRLREALFDILAFEQGDTFLDLFSGSGAIGLEAASRGWRATCVDLSREATGIIRGNATRAALRVEVVRGDALDFAREHPEAFGVVFAAPPYDLALTPIFQAILAAGSARAGGLYVFQHPSREPPTLDLPPNLEAPREKRYGTNALTLLRRSD